MTDGQQKGASPFAAKTEQQLRALSSTAAAAAAGRGQSFSNADSLVEVVTETDDKARRRELLLPVLLADGFAGCSIALLTSISIWRIVGHSQGAFVTAQEMPFADQFIWWAILFGPLGCYVRYYLSRYNGALAGGWKWFPVGTYAANMLACVLDYVVKAIEVRVYGLDALQLAVLNGMMSGIGGSLSTVSTWVVEVS